MLSLVLVSAFLTGASHSLSIRSPLCKAQAGTSNWPGPDLWNQLNASLSGALLKPLPPASACYSNLPGTYDTTQCGVVTESWYQSAFHSEDPVSVAYPNWQDDACLPPKLQNGNRTCRVDRFPTYVVDASKAEHISEAVKFAAEKNVRLVVKGRGHDLLGRSTAPSSLSIWTNSLRGITFSSEFASLCASIPKIPAITAHAGDSTGDVYQKLAEHNMTFVGAADPGVGLGGYLTGGGHSPLGSKYGMAVDNVLELSLVNAAGEVITANQCQNADLFWAMRGGGGATFGVLVNVTLRAHPIPPLTFARFEFNSTEEEASSSNNDNFYSAAAYVHTQLPTLANAGLAGYFSMMPLTSQGEAGSMNFAFLIYALSPTSEVLDNALDPILTRLNTTSGLTTSIAAATFPSFEAFRQTFLGAAPVGSNGFAASRLWDEDAVAKEDDLVSVLRKVSDQLLIGTFVSGEGVHSVPANQSALNPAWRKTVVHSRITVEFPLGSTEAEVRAAAQRADDITAVLKAQAPNMGVYSNEANIREPEYQTAFWGEHYTKLLEIKRRVDPDDVFWCAVCVGAERWSVTEGGRMCKS